jgi:hypothetical protein
MLIIATSAVIPMLSTSLEKMRENEYLQTIDWLKNNVLEEKFLFLETVAENSSFLEDYVPVYYSNSHNPSYQNIGSNLGNSLERFLEDYETEEELICQMTGRYHFRDRHFLDTIKDNPGYDFYGKDMGGQYFTGCFAMKKRHLTNWLNSTDWDDLNQRMINIEKSVFDYVQNKNLNAFHFDSIHMSCNVFGKGNPCKIEV